MTWKSLALAIGLVLVCNDSALAAPPKACQKVDGYVAGPFVPDERTAAGIYDAVAQVAAPGNRVRFPRTVADDEGDHWIVSQVSDAPHPPAKTGEVHVQIGRGQFVMSIDKCTGEISQASFAR